MKTERLVLRVSNDLKVSLTEMAQEMGTTVSSLVLSYISRGLWQDQHIREAMSPNNMATLLNGIGFNSESIASMMSDKDPK